MEITIRKTTRSGQIPTFKAGIANLRPSSYSLDQKNSIVKYEFGLEVKIPKGFVGFLFPVDSLLKDGLKGINTPVLIEPNKKIELSVSYEAVGGFYQTKLNKVVGKLVICPPADVEIIIP